MDKLKNPLNIPPPPLSLEVDDELPKAEDPIFLEPEVISIVIYTNMKY